MTDSMSAQMGQNEYSKDQYYVYILWWGSPPLTLCVCVCVCECVFLRMKSNDWSSVAIIDFLLNGHVISCCIFLNGFSMLLCVRVCLCVRVSVCVCKQAYGSAL